MALIHRLHNSYESMVDSIYVNTFHVSFAFLYSVTFFRHLALMDICLERHPVYFECHKNHLPLSLSIGNKPLSRFNGEINAPKGIFGIEKLGARTEVSDLYDITL